jgi:hypothetical protein
MTTYLFKEMLTSTCSAEIINTLLKNSVIFVKEADTVLTSYYWKVIVNVNLTPYEDAIGIFRTDLTEVEEATCHSTLIEEIQRVQATLDSPVNTLANLNRVLPKADRRRGLINAGGSLLQILFGTATESDLNNLHSTVDALNKKQNEIVHAVNQQVTFQTTRRNSQA